MNKDELIEKIREGLSTYKLAKHFHLSNNTVTYWIKKFGLQEEYKKHSKYGTVLKQTYTKERLEEYVKTSNSLTEVIEKYGIVPRGGNFKTIKYYINLYNISVDHFNPLKKRQGLKKITKINDLLKINTKIKSSGLKDRLYKYGLKQRLCELCGQGEDWKGNKMSLILDHINGVHTDNRIENLRIVCPNCNATLPTHCGKNKIKDTSFASKFKKIKKDSQSHLDKLRSKGIDLEILKEEVWKIPSIKLAKKYNCSDRYIGKICKRYNITKPPRGFWSKFQYGVTD